MASNFVQLATIGSCVRHVAQALAAAGIGDAPSEARRLVAAALALPGAALVSCSEAALEPDQQGRIQDFLDRRCRHEPLSRIEGEREFYGRPFTVTPATLDPRADSETLISVVLSIVAEPSLPRPLRILDIGTGTGCLLLTLLLELPQSRGVGTDISAQALSVARINAERHGASDRVTWFETDIASAVEGPFDIVVSNPPYVRSEEIAGLPAEVRNYDPRVALDGGKDGLRLYRAIARDLGKLVPNGWVVLEVGHDQADVVATELRASASAWAIEELRIARDVAGMRRVVAARTRSRGYAEKGLGFSGTAR